MDFNFTGDDPGPQTDPMPDAGDGWEEAVFEDDAANYREPGRGGAFSGEDPSVWDGEGDPDEPEYQGSDVPPVSTTNYRSKLVLLDRCDACGAFTFDGHHRCPLAPADEAVEGEPGPVPDPADVDPAITIDSTDEISYPDSQPVTDEVTAPEWRPTAFSFTEGDLDDYLPVTNDEEVAVLEAVEDGDVLRPIREHLDAVDALAAGAEPTVGDGMWERFDDFFDWLKWAIIKQSREQWKFTDMIPYEWTHAYTRDRMQDFFGMSAGGDDFDSLEAAIVDISDGLADEFVEGVMDFTSSSHLADFADVEGSIELETFLAEFQHLQSEDS
jgi:hypothetical protein